MTIQHERLHPHDQSDLFSGCPVDMQTTIVLSKEEQQIVQSFVQNVVDAANVRKEGTTREMRRKLANKDAVEPSIELMSLTAGVLVNTPELLRPKQAYEFIRQMFDNGIDGDNTAHLLVPASVEMARLFTVISHVGQQVGMELDKIDTPYAEYNLLKQYVSQESVSDDSSEIGTDIWTDGFYYAHGPHTSDSKITYLRQKLTNNGFDQFLVDELCQTDSPHEEIARTLDFARHMSGSDDWYMRLLRRPDLLSKPVQHLLHAKRQELLDKIDVTNASLESLALPALGEARNVEEEWKRIHGRFAEVSKRRIGRQALERNLQPVRIADNRPTMTIKASPDLIAKAPNKDEETRAEPLEIAEYVYDYSSGQYTNQSLEEALSSYAGHDFRLKGTLAKSCEYAAKVLANSKNLIGLEPIKQSNGKSDLWKIKPSEIPGLGGKNNRLRRTRILFCIADKEIKVVRIYHRDNQGVLG